MHDWSDISEAAAKAATAAGYIFFMLISIGFDI
jgi:hypothetical protein